jgi:hypothetical protein
MYLGFPAILIDLPWTRSVSVYGAEAAFPLLVRVWRSSCVLLRLKAWFIFIQNKLTTLDPVNYSKTPLTWEGRACSRFENVTVYYLIQRRLRTRRAAPGTLLA